MVSFESVKNVTTEEYFKGNEFAINTFRDKYSQVKDDGTKETPAEVWRRVASEIASMEETEEKREYWTNRWFSDLYEGYYRPGGSITAGIGMHKMSGEKSSLSNCVTISFQDDSLDSIFATFHRAAKNGSRRQGQGCDFSKLRPAGSRVGNAAKFSDGPVAWMRMFDSLANYIGQHNRRLALLFSLSISHPDIESFIACKDSLDSINNANISVVINREFIEAVEKDLDWELTFNVPEHEQTISKVVKARHLMRKIAEHAWKTGEPGIQAHDLMNTWGNSPYITNKRTNKKYTIVGTNACLPGNTKVVTKAGVREISDLVGVSTIIWDGISWFPIGGFFKTGENKDIYRVCLGDGSFFDATLNHEMVLESGDKVSLAQIKVGDVLAKSNVPVVKEGYRGGAAYFKGFLVGDGDTMKLQPRLRVANTKYMCIPKILDSIYEIIPDRGRIGVGEERGSSPRTGYYKNINGLENVKELYAWGKEFKGGLPSYVFGWDLYSKAEFIAGLFDADGYSQGRGSQLMYQFATISPQLAQDVHLLLQTMGVCSKLVAKAGVGSSIYGRHVAGRGIYVLTISTIEALKLAPICDFQRLKRSAEFSLQQRKSSIKQQSRYRTVVSIQHAGVCPEVFCCTVSSTHNFALANGLLSGNCSERPGTDNATCVLGSVNLGILPENFGEAKEVLKDKTYNLVRLLDNVIEYELSHGLAPNQEQKFVLGELREVGVGFTDIQGYLIKHDLAYDSDAGISMIEEIAKTLCRSAYTASELLGEEKGNFLAFSEQEFNSSPFVQRLKSLCPEVRCTSMRNCTLISIAPNGTLSLTFPTPNISSGIEPAPGFAYWKRSRVSGKWVWYFIISSVVREYAKKLGVDLGIDSESIEDQTGSVGEGVLRKLKDSLGDKLSIFKPAHLVDPMKKIELMARVYKFVDSAISTTYNLPEEASPELVEKLYIEAYKKGIKAVAIYRNGSRQGVIEFEPPPAVEKRFTICADTLRPEKIARRCAPKRPKELPCEIHQITVKGQKWIVPVGIYEGEPFEVFAGKSDVVQIPEKLRVGRIVKQGKNKYSLIIPLNDGETIEIKDMAAVFQNDEQNALTRQISLNLRTGTHLQFIVEQLKKGAGSIVDFSAAIARVLSKYIKPVVNRDEKCPQCGNDTLDRSQGCVKCVSCGWSRCE